MEFCLARGDARISNIANVSPFNVMYSRCIFAASRSKKLNSLHYLVDLCREFTERSEIQEVIGFYELFICFAEFGNCFLKICGKCFLKNYLKSCFVNLKSHEINIIIQELIATFVNEGRRTSS